MPGAALAYRVPMPAEPLEPPVAPAAGAGAGESGASGVSVAEPPARELTALDTPHDGVPPVVATPQALADAVAALAAGSGPVAVDAERASGHRYGQRAFLVQLRRDGAGTVLLDPAALPDLSAVGTALDGTEWVLHAASQDLPCLADLGMHPRRLFDTELGSRLAGLQRVGLAAVVEELLGLSLAKEHSAVDWSTRPLPEPWLRYAALDVEVLVELRDVLAAELERQGKLEWALAGVRRPRGRRALGAPARPVAAHVGDAPGAHPPPAGRRPRALGGPRPAGAPAGRLTRPDHPRRLHRRGRRSPSRRPSAPWSRMSSFTGRGSRRHADLWFDAIRRALDLPEAELPPQHLPTEGPPPPRVWAERDPAAAARLTRARAAMAALAEEHGLPVENLLSPDTVRRLCWTPPDPVDEGTVRAALADRGARPWQVDLTAPALTGALQG